MRHARFICDISGLSADGQPYDDIEDTELPVGWLEITIREVRRNQDYDGIMADYESRREAAVAQAVDAQPDGVDPGMVESMIDAMMPEPDVAEFEVVERVLHVESGCRSIALGPFNDSEEDDVATDPTAAVG